MSRLWPNRIGEVVPRSEFSLHEWYPLFILSSKLVCIFLIHS